MVFRQYYEKNTAAWTITFRSSMRPVLTREKKKCSTDYYETINNDIRLFCQKQTFFVAVHGLQVEKCVHQQYKGMKAKFPISIF
ncbi:MAG: hypothetical protein BAW33_05350 [Desulfobacterales bacterium C00003104]|nr:MAG: hypothetical protein BAW33_05350 [Desulfobacterales bacterium C00003104]